MAERIWHPITELDFFMDHTSGWLADVREFAGTLEEARHKPYVLSDADVARVKRVYTEQAEHITLGEEQAERWAALPALDADQRAGLAALTADLAELRALNRQVLALADELAKGTINTVMATPDAELGLAALLGERPNG